VRHETRAFHLGTISQLSIAHPSPEDLEEYYFARFDWQQRELIESHLSHCG
jgi:hypothetical protein